MPPAIASLPETRRLVVTAALQKLFDAQRFDICTLRTVLEALQLTHHTEAFELLRTLHCINYADMEPALRDRIPLLVNEALRPPVRTCHAAETALQGVEL